MRTIKFNVYDNYLKQFICKGIHILGETLLFGMIENYCDENPNPKYKHSIQRFDDIVFLQFTGLFDKNGVEIYEGDFLKTSDMLIECKWSEAKFVFMYKDWICNPESKWIEETSKVIGNIYETPELI